MKRDGFGALALVAIQGLVFAGCSGILGDFDPSEEFIPAEDIDRVVDEQMADIERAYLRVGGEELAIVDLDLDDEGLVFLFDGGEVVLGFDLGSGEPTGSVSVLYGDVPDGGDGELEVTRRLAAKRLEVVEDDGSWQFSGELEEDGGAGVLFDGLINEAFVGAGTTRFEISGDQAVLRGVLGTRTYAQFRDLVAEHPQVETIVLADVPGSMNDAVNMHTGRLLRRSGLATRVEADGVIASGGVDLFAAGVRREVETGARLGVHSWCCVRGRSAHRLRREHPAHAGQVAYFGEMMGDRGPDFYFYTLEAAHFDGIHWMLPEEIRSWELATDWIESPES